MNTTICISEDVKNQLREYGMKGETYNDILQRILEHARQRQLQELLMDETGTIPVREALEKAKRRWRK